MSLFGRISAGYPRDPRRLSTGFCTRDSAAIPQIFRVFSTRFAHLFHPSLTSEFRRRFPQPFRNHSGGKMGENRAVIQNLRKSRKTVSARQAGTESEQAE